MIIDGYVRVSQVRGRSGESFLSPSTQREQIESWARQRGALIAEVFEELDESGGRLDRPLLEKATCRIERGESEGLVVAYMSRFGRSLLHGLMTIDRITKAGGAFVSVQEGLDFSTDIGRLMLRQWLSWAEWELDRSRAGWHVARERAVARGAWMTSRPFGYRKGRSGRLTAHPVEAPIVIDLYRRRAAGEPIQALCESLMKAGVLTAAGYPTWRREHLREVLASRRYRGEVRHGEFFNPCGHDALIDEATWQLVQRDISDHHLVRPSRSRTGALLQGIVRCGGCRWPLRTRTIYRGASFEHRFYACGGNGSEGACMAPVAVWDVAVEPHVEALFWEELARPARPATARRVRTLTEAVVRREREVVAYRDNVRVPQVIGTERFVEGLAIRQRRVDKARIELQHAQPESDIVPLPGIAELQKEWPSLTIEQRRVLLGRVIEAVFVLPSKGRGSDRLVAYRRGFAPPELPRRWAQRAGVPLQPLDVRSAPPPLRLRRRPIDWSEQRIREALDPLLAGRDRWPSFPDFQAVGLASLYAQIDRQVGHHELASIMGVPFRAPNRPEGNSWSEERIRLELATYLQGQGIWPTRSQFKQDGRDALRDAISRHGGGAYWAAEMGVRVLRGPSARQRWSYIRMRHELADFASGRDDWPPAREFYAAGRRALYGAIARAKAQKKLASDLGLRLPPTDRVAPRRHWTDERIRVALDGLVIGLDWWPSYVQFRDAGLRSLYERLRATGTLDAWRKRYGLPLPPGFSGRSRWTDEVIRAQLDKFVAGRGSWPSAQEFRDAGLWDLRYSLRRGGTLERWASSYGLELPRGEGPRKTFDPV
jgi:DNA invertase Pin-like site-specific DNA recombinase